MEGEGIGLMRGDRQETQAQLEERIREELFIESGITVEEIMEAFKQYGLKMEVTQEDRLRFQKEA